MEIKKILFIYLITGSSLLLNAQSFEAVKGLAARRVPWLASNLVFSTIPKENDKDAFELFSKKNKVYISATNANTAACALNWYLKYYCNRSMSHRGDNMLPVKKIPPIDGTIRIVSPYNFRYVLNYSYNNYNVSFYSWKDWERELDWMALNGVNLMSAPVGVEAVWQNTLKKFDFNDEEIFDFLPGPSYTSLWHSGIIEGAGGRLSQGIIDQQVVLEKMILKRMKGLGIQPIMPGFYGMVPSALKNKVKAKILNKEKGLEESFKKPAFLVPTDSFFKEISGVYYYEMKKLYGADIHFFAGDLLDVNQNLEKEDFPSYVKEIQLEMRRHFTSSTWLLHSQQDYPSSKLLEALDKSKTMVVMQFDANKEYVETFKRYAEMPFLWNSINNFGDKSESYNKLQRFSENLYYTKNGPYGPFLKGIGPTFLGTQSNPFIMDFILESGWHTDKVDVKEWIKNYVKYRYGKSNDNIITAWQVFLETIYKNPDIYHESNLRSIFCTAPSLTIKSNLWLESENRNDEVLKFVNAVRLFLSDSEEFEDCEAYQADKVDLLRKVNSSKGYSMYQNMLDAINRKDLTNFIKFSNRFQQMILMQDDLLNSSPYFSLHTLLKEATDFGISPEDKATSLRNAKEQVSSYWASSSKTYSLSYGGIEWGGLMGSLYLQKWKQFENEQSSILKNQTVNLPNYIEMERKWVLEQDLFIPRILTKEEKNSMINVILSSEP